MNSIRLQTRRINSKRIITMSRLNAISVLERDTNRLRQPSGEKDLIRMLDQLVRVVTEDISIMSLQKVRVTLDKISTDRKLPRALHQLLLDRLKISSNQWSKV